MEKLLTASVQYLKGIGPKRVKVLNKAGLYTIEDMLYYFPYRYEDRTNFISIDKLEEGKIQTIKGKIVTSSTRTSWRRRSFSITEALIEDNTGRIKCVWFNQGYLKEYFKPGVMLILYGKVDRYGERLQLGAPEFEIISEEDTDNSLNVGRIVPIYSLFPGMTQRHIRQLIKYVLDEYLPKISEYLPYDIRKRNNLFNLAKSILNIHFPENLETRLQAYERLSFDEFFFFQLPLALRKLKKNQDKGITHAVEGALAKSFMSELPFNLTKGQQEVLNEIKIDMGRASVMQRLLQGDVGSGKTIVATIAGIFAIQGGFQAAFMAPTEILAKQHYEKISCQLSAVSCQQKKIRISLIAGSLDKKEKEKIYKEIKSGKIDLLIGTHALLKEDLEFKNLGLVIIDEQHKFGVGQRALLPRKGANPDVLIMTATPIPRTLAITLYGDLDISVINELPPGRLPIKTIHFKEEEAKNAYDIVKEQLSQGFQAYVVCPVIEDSFALDIAGVKKRFAQLKAGALKDFRLGLIHGQLANLEQDEIMFKFKNKELDVLVSTTILEVGIDVSRATCMVIEKAERFGLAQLHQLRGRVGRDKYPSVCLLISDAKTAEAKARIEAMVKYNDGFRIAEEDLKIRGPGEFFGARQHGLSELKIGNPLTQMQLLKHAREEAIKLINLDPGLIDKSNTLLRKKLLERFPEYERLMVIG